MAKKRICGIYCIENLITNKKYIGQSVDINRRWREHKKKLNDSLHYNEHLQSAWNKYGENNFHFYVLEQCDKIDLNDKEIFWIGNFDTFNNGYNNTIGGDNLSENTSKEVFMYNLNGEYLRSFSSITEAIIYLGKGTITTITKCCNGELKTAYGYIWKFYFSPSITPKTLALQNVTRNKSVYKYDLNGYYLDSYENPMDAKRKNNINLKSNNITSCCNGKKKSAYGYRWSYEKCERLDLNLYEHKNLRDVPIYKYDLNGNLITKYNNSNCLIINDEYTKNQLKTIQGGCGQYRKTKKVKVCYGYVFSYEELPLEKFENLSDSRIKNKSVYKYDLNGNYLSKYNSLKDAALCCFNDEKNIRGIMACCLNNAHTAYGFIWKYYKEEKLQNIKGN